VEKGGWNVREGGSYVLLVAPGGRPRPLLVERAGPWSTKKRTSEPARLKKKKKNTKIHAPLTADKGK